MASSKERQRNEPHKTIWSKAAGDFLFVDTSAEIAREQELRDVIDEIVADLEGGAQ